MFAGFHANDFILVQGAVLKCLAKVLTPGFSNLDHLMLERGQNNRLKLCNSLRG